MAHVIIIYDETTGEEIGRYLGPHEGEGLTSEEVRVAMDWTKIAEILKDGKKKDSAS